jgi:predicted DNA-binding transcriptional regulator YafY
MKKSHDTIARRLSSILLKFNSGERFTIEELCEEFNVDKRTIQRDINERFSYFPIKKENGYYFLESYALGKLTFEDIKNFAAISGIKELYPALTNEFIADILNAKINSAYLVKSLDHEPIASKTGDFQSLSVAILQNIPIRCIYKEKPRLLHPYKLVNQQGIWYLVADENGVLKNFSFTKITDFELLDESRFEPKREFVETIQKNEVTWFSQNVIEVTLEIDGDVSEYFLRRNMFPNQTIISQHEGTLTLKTKISYDEEILRIVQYWLPHIKIIEPTHLQEKLNDLLSGYLKTT